MQQIGFGGGCHWCTEAVLVTFDPDVIRLEDLLNVHLATHASTSFHIDPKLAKLRARFTDLLK